MPGPQVVIPRLVFEKIMHMVMKGGSHEVSGLGVTEIIGHNIVVRDVLMGKQKNSGASTDMEAEDVAQLLYRFHMTHPGLEANFWWHSHADMNVFWSVTDRATIAQIGGAGMCIATVFNKKRETRSAVASMSPFPFFLDDIKTVIDPIAISDELKASWDAEYTENVHKPTYFQKSEWQEFPDGWERDESGCWIRDKAKKEEWDKRVPLPKLPTVPSDRITDSKRTDFGDDIDIDLAIDRWDWAHEREYIVDYNPLKDEFQLRDGVWRGAEDYIAEIERTEKEYCQ
jgi:proteasome lid subunit RPN8/RPN11